MGPRKKTRDNRPTEDNSCRIANEPSRHPNDGWVGPEPEQTPRDPTRENPPVHPSRLSFSARASHSSHWKILCRRTTKRKNTQDHRCDSRLWLDPGITRTEGTENRAAIERMRQRRGRVIADGGGSRYQIECREKTRRAPAEDGVSGLQEPERERR